MSTCVSLLCAAISAGFFLMTVSLWARLILALSSDDKEASLSLGISWLAQAGGFVLAVLTCINLIFASRRVADELEEILAIEDAKRAAKEAAREAKEAAKEQKHHHHHKGSRRKGSADLTEEGQAAAVIGY